MSEPTPAQKAAEKITEARRSLPYGSILTTEEMTAIIQSVLAEQREFQVHEDSEGRRYASLVPSAGEWTAQTVFELLQKGTGLYQAIADAHNAALQRAVADVEHQRAAWQRRAAQMKLGNQLAAAKELLAQVRDELPIVLRAEIDAFLNPNEKRDHEH